MWRWCTALTPLPSLSARTLIWYLSRKNVQHLPNSPMPPVFWAGHKSPFLCECSGSKSQCRSIGCHPSSLPTPLHCIRHSGWAGWHPDSNISHRWSWTSWTIGGRIHLNHSFKGSIIHYLYCVFLWVGTAQLHWIQREHIRVFGQELMGIICQFRGPRVQPTQIQFIE